MLIRRFQLVLVWLVATSLLLQSLWAGVPAGLSLCIGCADEGWTISQSHASDSAKACCASEETGTERASSLAIERHECGCIRIPVTRGEDLTLLASRVASPTSQAPAPITVVAFVALTTTSDATPKVRPPRAGPESPPRLLTPLSRCTVLLL